MNKIFPPSIHNHKTITTKQLRRSKGCYFKYCNLSLSERLQAIWLNII